jgi:hypothetical protein
LIAISISKVNIEVAPAIPRPKVAQRFYPSSAREQQLDLRATTKEAQHRHPANNHPPLSTSLPPHNTAKMLLGMKKFPVKVRKYTRDRARSNEAARNKALQYKR